MPQGAPDHLKAIWRQDNVPVVVRLGEGHRLQVKIPGVLDHPIWRIKVSQQLRRLRPKGQIPQWLPKAKGWDIPNSWFNDLINHFLAQFGRVYVIQPYREQEKCAPACMNASRHECECSCLGANHGAGGPNSGWFVASESFATRWGEKSLASRLLTRTK